MFLISSADLEFIGTLIVCFCFLCNWFHQDFKGGFFLREDFYLLNFKLLSVASLVSAI